MPTSEEWAYLAGLFDGEGNIAAHTTNGRGSFSFRVRMGMTSEKLIWWVRGITGLGQVYQYQSSNSNWKPVFNWIISKRSDILDFLVAVEPYLKLKRDQARLMISLLESRLSRHGRTGGTHTALNPIERQLIESLREANVRGQVDG